jgi:hypothetical protein
VHGRMDQKVARKNILYSSFGSMFLHYVIAWHNAEGYDSYKSLNFFHWKVIVIELNNMNHFYFQCAMNFETNNHFYFEQKSIIWYFQIYDVMRNFLNMFSSLKCLPQTKSLTTLWWNHQP